jgi:hypothetical protein
MTDGNLTSSLTTIACDIHVHYTTYLMVAMVVLSWFTRELLVFLLSTAIQLQTVFILAMSQYIGRCSVDQLCPLTPDNCYSWPSNELAQVGALIGTIMTYNTLWEYWHCATITKVGGIIMLTVAAFIMLLTGMTSPGAGALGFVIGLAMSVVLVTVTRRAIYKLRNRTDYTDVLYCSRCTDNLVGNKYCNNMSNVVNL